MRAIPTCLDPFLKSAEGNRLKAYRDSSGNLTIGVGHMDPKLQEGEVWTQAQVDSQEASDASEARAKLYGRVDPGPINSLSDHQYAAILSFVFNLGAGSPSKPLWNIWKLMNAGRIDAVPAEMMRFDKARDPHTGELETVNGLVSRRAAEVRLWNTGDVAAAGAIAAANPAALPSAILRDADTPPTPAVVKPLAQSGRFLASCAAAVSSVCAAGANAALPMLQPAADGAAKAADQLEGAAAVSHTLAHARNFLIVGGALIGVATPGLIWMAHHQAKNR